MEKKHLNLLIVDDRPENLMVLESLLEPLEICIVKASSGNEALGLLLEYDFFLVLMDVQMPGMNGFEAAELMRGSQRTKHIPIIFVTAISKEQQYVFKGYEIGAVDYLFKPIEPIVLISKIKVFMELKVKTIELQVQAEKLEEKVEELILLQQSHYNLETLSFCDGLTGISNRRRFDEYLLQEWNRGIREKMPLSIVLLDIDFFKKYNDIYGHLQGDECLRQVAKSLESNLRRSTDFVGRYGGEEFVFVLPNTEQEGAYQIAEQARKKIWDLKIPHQHSSIAPYVTISLGVHTRIPDTDTDIPAFMEKADKALYEAKQSGRNRSVLYVSPNKRLP